MLSRFKVFSIDGIIARGMRVAALTLAALGFSEWAVQSAAIFGLIETFGVKKMSQLINKKGKKKHGKRRN